MLYGCTTFTIKSHSELIFGRNLDVESDIGNVFINPRLSKKTAYFSKNSKEIPAKWTSKFGNITFNQISRDIPHGGINEKGLVVEHLFLEESVYEKSDTRPALMSHQWIQYMLDNCASVNEIIESCSRVRISDVDSKFPIHFNTMDRNGDSAIFEFLNGKMLIYKNDACKAGVLSNSTFENSIKSISNIDFIPKTNSHPTDITNSLERFKKATDLVKKYDRQDVIKYGFSILDAVKNNTQWQIIYDILNLKIYYRTKSQKTIRSLNIVDCNFTGKKNRAICLNKNPETETNWVTFNDLRNKEMIYSICNNSEFINAVLGQEKEEIANYGHQLEKFTSS